MFPLADVKTYMTYSKTEKEARVLKWCGLVTGIRLFNKSLGKGGENIGDGELIYFIFLY